MKFQNLKTVLKRWAENEFKSDPQLNLIPSLYQKLKSEGHDFSEPTKVVKKEKISKDPNVVSSQQEEDDIAKAIELSLKDSSPKTIKTDDVKSNLYPLVGQDSVAKNNSSVEPRKVRALYDFEAAEDNELTFFAGDILLVLDDSDLNWWKGENSRGEGLFPANFVTADLSAEPETRQVTSVDSKKAISFEEIKKEEPAFINEETIDRLFHLLHDADPEDPSQDSDDMLRLENMVNQMGPLIDAELDNVDRKHGQLSQLSADFAEAVTLYHSLQLMTVQSNNNANIAPASFLPNPGYFPTPQSQFVAANNPSSLPQIDPRMDGRMTSRNLAPAPMQFNLSAHEGYIPNYADPTSRQFQHHLPPSMNPQFQHNLPPFQQHHPHAAMFADPSTHPPNDPTQFNRSQ